MTFRAIIYIVDLKIFNRSRSAPEWRYIII
nr:MAG TPA: hypothetical protein [Caudoviricetes sp.]